MSDPLPLLWLDLETTGLSTTRDFILEAACFVTSPTGEKDESSVRSWVIKPYESKDWYSKMNEFVLNMHIESGLLADIEEKGILPTQWLNIFFEYLEQMLKDHDADKLTIAGSGVGPFDAPMLKGYMPTAFDEFFTYYVMDVGVVGRFLRNQCGIQLPERPKVIHRALADIEDHYAEFMSYQDWIKMIST